MSDLPAGAAAATDVTGRSGKGRSLADRLKEHRASETLDLSIPRFGGLIVIRYGKIPMQAIVKSTRQKAGPLAGNADLLAAACKEIFSRSEDGDLVALREEDGGAAPIGFDARLAEILSLNGESARRIVLGAYGDNVAVNAHADKVYKWQTGAELDDTTIEDLEDELGEEDAAT